MPDVQSRAKREAQLTSLLLRANSRHRQEIETALGIPPDPSRVPPSLLERIEQEINTAALALLLLMYLDAFDGMGKAFRQVSPSRSTAERNADDWATARARQVSRQWRENTQNGLNGLGRLNTPAEVSGRLDTIFGEGRASTIATTETTGAISAGEADFAGQVLEMEGDVMFATWQTEEDARVCPVCAPLNDKPQTDWDGDFPTGPPAHPNCRCYLVYELMSIDQFEAKVGV